MFQTIVDIGSATLIISGAALCFRVWSSTSRVFNAAFGALFVAAGYVQFIFAPRMAWQLAACLTCVFSGALALAIDRAIHALRDDFDPDGSSERGLIATIGLALVIQYGLVWWFGADVLPIAQGRVVVGHEVQPWVFRIVSALGACYFVMTAHRSEHRARWDRGSIACAGGLILLAALPLGHGTSALLPRERMVTMAVACTVLIVGEALVRSRVGLRWRAFVGSTLTARLCGLAVDRYRVVAVGLAGTAIGALGAAYANDVGVRFETADRILVGAAFAGLLSSVGSISRVLIAGALLSSATYVAVRVLSSNMANVVSLGMLLLLVMAQTVRGELD